MLLSPASADLHGGERVGGGEEGESLISQNLHLLNSVKYACMYMYVHVCMFAAKMQFRFYKKKMSLV